MVHLWDLPVFNTVVIITWWWVVIPSWHKWISARWRGTIKIPIPWHWGCKTKNKLKIGTEIQNWTKQKHQINENCLRLPIGPEGAGLFGGGPPLRIGGPLFGGGPLDDIPLKKGSTISMLSHYFADEQTNIIYTIGSVLLREQVKNQLQWIKLNNHHHSPQVMNCKNKGRAWNLFFFLPLLGGPRIPLGPPLDPRGPRGEPRLRGCIDEGPRRPDDSNWGFVACSTLIGLPSRALEKQGITVSIYRLTRLSRQNKNGYNAHK